jgi:hypothetical protein
VRLTRKRLLIAVPAVLLALFFLSARYGSDGQGVYVMARPPFLDASVGPAWRYIVRSGVNVVGDSGVGMAGNVLEFPVTPGSRISLRVFSVRWLRQEFRAFRSDHPRLAPWLGGCNCPIRPAAEHGSPH